MIASFGETEKQFCIINSPNNKIYTNSSFGKQLGTLDQSQKNKWMIDFSLDNFRKSRSIKL